MAALALHKLWQRRSLRMPPGRDRPARDRGPDPLLAHHPCAGDGRPALPGRRARQLHAGARGHLAPGDGPDDHAPRARRLDGCIGLHGWLRLRPWYRPLQALLGWADLACWAWLAGGSTRPRKAAVRLGGRRPQAAWPSGRATSPASLRPRRGRSRPGSGLAATGRRGAPHCSSGAGHAPQLSRGATRRGADERAGGERRTRISRRMSAAIGAAARLVGCGWARGPQAWSDLGRGAARVGSDQGGAGRGAGLSAPARPDLA